MLSSNQTNKDKGGDLGEVSENKLLTLALEDHMATCVFRESGASGSKALSPNLPIMNIH